MKDPSSTYSLTKKLLSAAQGHEQNNRIVDNPKLLSEYVPL